MTLGRSRAIEQGRGAPPTAQELAEHRARKARLSANAELRAYLERITEQYKEAKPLLDHWGELTPQQRRRFEDVEARHAPMILRLLPTVTRMSTGRPREHRARRRRTTTRRTRAGATRAGPDDPEPGGAGLQRLQRLRVIAPDRFRRDVDAWLEAR